MSTPLCSASTWGPWPTPPKMVATACRQRRGERRDGLGDLVGQLAGRDEDQRRGARSAGGAIAERGERGDGRDGERDASCRCRSCPGRARHGRRASRAAWRPGSGTALVMPPPAREATIGSGTPSSAKFSISTPSLTTTGGTALRWRSSRSAWARSGGDCTAVFCAARGRRLRFRRDGAPEEVSAKGMRVVRVLLDFKRRPVMHWPSARRRHPGASRALHSTSSPPGSASCWHYPTKAATVIRESRRRRRTPDP